MNIIERGNQGQASQDKFLLDLLSSWTKIHFHLPELSLEEVERAVYLEKTQVENRERVQRRLIGKANRLRLAQDLEAVGLGG